MSELETNEKKIRRTTAFHKNEEDLFISDAITDLKRGETTYVYREKQLDKLKEIFKDLDIRRNDFYWTVRNKGVSK